MFCLYLFNDYRDRFPFGSGIFAVELPAGRSSSHVELKDLLQFLISGLEFQTIRRPVYDRDLRAFSDYLKAVLAFLVKAQDPDVGRTPDIKI